MLYPALKSILDRIFALILLFILSPLLLFTALVLYVLEGRPIFFVQRRPGLNHQLFPLVKFRTMHSMYIQSGTGDIARIHRLGKLLRQYSIDELPSLLNILAGQMSFVGPRPLLQEYLPLYSSRQALRHKVLPGLTGLAQVNGRNKSSWHRRFAYDYVYASRQSLFLDLFILLKTFLVIAFPQHINSSQHYTMEPFRG